MSCRDFAITVQLLTTLFSKTKMWSITSLHHQFSSTVTDVTWHFVLLSGFLKELLNPDLPLLFGFVVDHAAYQWRCQCSRTGKCVLQTRTTGRCEWLLVTDIYIGVHISVLSSLCGNVSRTRLCSSPQLCNEKGKRIEPHERPSYLRWSYRSVFLSLAYPHVIMWLIHTKLKSMAPISFTVRKAGGGK